jgi:DNA-binding beta-propeller fold protein YncE
MFISRRVGIHVRGFAFAAAAMLVATGAASAEQRFVTIAGSGAAGIADGPAMKATFLLPYGVAVAKDGTIYVSDYFGQRIRAVSPSGQVWTVAGGGALESDGLRVAGGYRDGPAKSARFNFPSGITLDANGAIYVADAGNGCIRIIKDGVVRTLAGAPSRKVADGPLATAGFAEPRALAFDGHGNLFVADFGNGLRRIGTDGNVTTIAMPDAFRFTTSVSWEADTDRIIVANNSAIYFVNNLEGGPKAFEISHQLNNTQGAMFVGSPFQVAVLGDGNYIFTDEREQAIRLYDIGLFTQSLTVTPSENYEIAGGGYRDGVNGLVQMPLGIAPLNATSVVFADAGNHRVRELRDIETRHYATDHADPFGQFHDAEKYYRIMVMSDCYGGWAVPFDETAGGRLEAQLNANRRQLGIPRPVRVSIVWLGDASDIRNYVRDVASTGIADLVVWEFNDAMPNDEFPRLTLHSPLDGLAAWKPTLSVKVAQIGKSFRDNHIPYYVVMHPTTLYFPALEDRGPVGNLGMGDDVLQWSQVTPIYTQMFAGNTDGLIDAGPAMIAAEQSPHRMPLFQGDTGYEFSAAGNAVLERVLYKHLASERPWLKSAHLKP